MDPKELRGLMEAYAEVYAPQEVDEATAMAKRGHDETAIRQKIAKSTGGGEAADRATALADRQDFRGGGSARDRLARAQRGDFRNTTSSNPGLHGYGHKSDDPAVKAKQAARGAQRGVLTPAEKARLNREEVEQVDENRYAMRNPEEYERMQRKPKQKSERERRMNDPHTGINSPAFQQFMKQQMGGSGGKKKTNEEVDVFDVVLELLQAEGYAETLEEAQWIMANELDAEDIDAILDEAYVDYRRGKLPSGRTPQQATHDREDALKARQKRDETLGKGSNPETYNQRGRIARQSETRSQMDRTTTLGARFGGKMSRGEPSLGRHQRAIDRRSAIQGAQDADKKTRG